ncbi:MAG: class I adenylate-forming enzyme family protein [Pseudomonadota bacterium]
MLAGEILRFAAARLPDKTALIEGGRRLSFAELDRRANSCAGAIAALGLEKGARLAILAPNLLEFPIVYWGAARAGVILATVSTRATPGEVAYMLGKTGAEALVFWGEAGTTVGLARRQASLRHLVALGPVTGEPGPGSISFDDFMALGAGRPPALDLADTDPQAMNFTGGTTGFPKAVLVTHRARYATAVTCAVEFGLDERDVSLVATPLFHAAGLFVWLQPSIMLGCTCVLLQGWDAGRFIELVERHGASAALLVPTQLSDLLVHPAFAAERLKSLRHIHYAASPMPVALYDRLRAALPHVAFTENYGSSETGPMTVRRPFHPHDKRASVGRPAHNVEVRIVDKQGREVKAGGVGEVVTRGPHLLKEYWGEPEQTAALFRIGEGWLATGDLGFRDGDGFITLVDRSKDMLISGGENIYPSEIENVLFRHPAVAECAVFGIPDQRLGEVPAAHVVLRHGLSATPEELIEFVAGAIARHKRPRLVKLADRLPKTAVGKIQKNLLREPYWQGTGRRI